MENSKYARYVKPGPTYLVETALTSKARFSSAFIRSGGNAMGASPWISILNTSIIALVISTAIDLYKWVIY